MLIDFNDIVLWLTYQDVSRVASFSSGEIGLLELDGNKTWVEHVLNMKYGPAWLQRAAELIVQANGQGAHLLPPDRWGREAVLAFVRDDWSDLRNPDLSRPVTARDGSPGVIAANIDETGMVHFGCWYDNPKMRPDHGGWWSSSEDAIRAELGLDTVPVLFVWPRWGARFGGHMLREKWEELLDKEIKRYEHTKHG